MGKAALPRATISLGAAYETQSNVLNITHYSTTGIMAWGKPALHGSVFPERPMTRLHQQSGHQEWRYVQKET